MTDVILWLCEEHEKELEPRIYTRSKVAYFPDTVSICSAISCMNRAVVRVGVSINE